MRGSQVSDLSYEKSKGPKEKRSTQKESGWDCRYDRDIADCCGSIFAYKIMEWIFIYTSSKGLSLLFYTAVHTCRH
ncbi:hypothetical protein BHE74_00031546 [Ensete ventricosum]|nr:hypothetical protein GW17_00029824 [Ensete ventricosum]RWW61395.1 hypothetical protein BHE74_00031546 [Ensete ventricosum]RZR77837.1 hypothetical protein BHM03_00003037 [Ensete ventricosum]